MSREWPAVGRVLHVMQDTVMDPSQRHLGSTKGIRCRTDHFEARGIPFDELVTGTSSGEVLEAVRGATLHRYTAVVFEHTHSPAALKWVRRTVPELRIISSTHNAEFFHRLDILRAEGLTLQAPRQLNQLIKKTLRDVRCGRLADFVLTVNEWEVEHYWARFVPRSRVRYMPWHLPEAYQRELPSDVPKLEQCVCLLSTIPNAIIADAALRFCDAVRGLGGDCGDWEFLMTGDPTRYTVRTPARVRLTGLLDSPYPLLAQARAMALLSDYGYGFKTKILEAILTRTYVIMTETMFQRLPVLLQPYCIPVVRGSARSFAAALIAARRPFPDNSVNAVLRDRAFEVLDGVLGFTK